MAQDDKKFPLLCTISQEPYIMGFLFEVCKCKMIISPGFFVFFHFFKILIFLVFRGGERAKNDPLITSFSLSHSISRTVDQAINKCQTEILGCAPPSHLCDFFSILQIYKVSQYINTK